MEHIILLCTTIFLVGQVYAGCPSNSSLSNGKCYCNANFVAQQGRCVTKYVELQWIGNLSFCHLNYVKKGGRCEAYFIPINGHPGPFGQWTCDLTHKPGTDKCVQKSYEELVETVNALFWTSMQNRCDDFVRECESECDGHSSCVSACKTSEDPCEEFLDDVCRQTSRVCNSMCQDSACVTACEEAKDECED